MKLVSLGVAVVFAFACSDSTAPVPAPRSAWSPRSADVYVNQTTPSALVTFNPCNGDVVVLTGTAHLVLGTTQSNGNSEHISFDLSNNYSGVGVPSTLSYTASHTTHD